MTHAFVVTHTLVGLVVLVALLIGGGYAFLQIPRRVGFQALPFVLVVAVVDLQVTLGVIVYLLEKGWRDNVFIAVIHPAVMLLTLALVHVGLMRARRRLQADAFRNVGVAFLVALVLVALGIPWQRVTVGFPLAQRPDDALGEVRSADGPAGWSTPEKGSSERQLALRPRRSV